MEDKKVCLISGIGKAAAPELAGATGGYYDEKRRRVEPSAYAKEPGQQDRLMETTARFLRRV